MQPNPRAALRKTPRQQRSREMVERIVDAGQAVLIAHGYEGASTNRIAAAAGISPGSLYQYFPNKDAIVGAVIDRYHGAVIGRVRAEVVKGMAAPPDLALRLSIEALIDGLGEYPELLRAVVEHTPQLSGARTVANFESQMVELTGAALTLRNFELPAGADIDTASWMLVRVVEHLTIRYVLDCPPISREAFLQNLIRMIRNYFRR
jgi:AcrR family transcriptional regulator